MMIYTKKNRIKIEITMCGEPVRTSSPGCSANRLSMVRSASSWAVKKPLLFVFVESVLFCLLLSLFEEFFISMDDIWWFVVDVTSVDKCIFSLLTENRILNSFYLFFRRRCIAKSFLSLSQAGTAHTCAAYVLKYEKKNTENCSSFFMHAMNIQIE